MSDDKAALVAELLADTEPMPDPAAVALADLGLTSVADARWLDADNDAPKLRTLLTMANELGDRQVPFMPASKVAILASPGGTGKSQALVQLAVAVASGRPWLDTYAVTEPGAVLLAMGEEDKDEMHRRIRGAVDAMRAWPEVSTIATNLHALSLCGKEASMIDKNGEETAFYKTFRAGLAAWPGGGWRLIILDPASRFLGPEAEKDAAQATRFIEALERLTTLPGGPTVLFAHHTNKNGLAGETDQGAARGSSALTDGARWQANLDRCHHPTTKADANLKKKGKLIPNMVELRVVKANHCPIAPELSLVRDLERGGFLAPGNLKSAAEPTAPRKTEKDKKEELVAGAEAEAKHKLDDAAKAKQEADNFAKTANGDPDRLKELKRRATKLDDEARAANGRYERLKGELQAAAPLPQRGRR